MGTEALWIPAVMAVVGAGATYANNRSQANRADKINAQALLKQGERQKRADSKVTELIDRTGQSNAVDEKAGLMGGYLQQLAQAQSGAKQGLGTSGAASSRYAQEATAAALGIDTGGKEYADLTARLDAPILQRQGEGIDRSRTGTDLGTIVREQEGDDANTALRLRSIRDNPWLMALASAASGVGAGYSGAGGAKKAPVSAANYDSIGPIGTSVWSSLGNNSGARYG